MSDTPNPSPFLAVPPVVTALAAIFFGVQCLFAGAEAGYYGGPAAIGWRLNAFRDYGFSVQVFDWMIQNRTFAPEHLLRFVSYPFLHGTFTHAIFVCVFILAMGKAISPVFNTWRFLVLFFGAGIVGALAYGLLLEIRVPLIGGFPGAYGLIGAFTWLLWMRARAGGENPYRAFTLIGMLAGIQLVFGTVFGGGGSWVAEAAGFAFGFGGSFLLAPGGFARLRARLRHR